MANPIQMPLWGTQNVPNSKSFTQVPHYLEDIEFLGISANLTDEEHIRAAIWYVDLDEADVWKMLPEASATNPDW